MKTQSESPYRWEDGDGKQVIYCLVMRGKKGGFLGGYDITRNQIKRVLAGKKVKLPAWVVENIQANYTKPQGGQP